MTDVALVSFLLQSLKSIFSTSIFLQPVMFSHVHAIAHDIFGHHFGTDWFLNNYWVAMRFGIDINVPLRMNYVMI